MHDGGEQEPSEVGATIELNHFEALCLSMRAAKNWVTEEEKKHTEATDGGV